MQKEYHGLLEQVELVARRSNPTFRNQCAVSPGMMSG